MNKFTYVLGAILTIGGLSVSAQDVGVGYKSDGADVSGDFAESEGDGGSVSADVTVGFKIGKKVALAIKGENGEFTNSELFAAVRNNIENSVFYSTIAPIERSPGSAYSIGGAFIRGAIYTNSENTLFEITTPPKYVHESDPSSFVVADCALYTGASLEYQGGCRPLKSITVNASNLTDTDGALSFMYTQIPYLSSVTASHRSGVYYGVSVVTVTLP